MSTIFNQARQHLRLTQRLNVSATKKAYIMLAIIGLVLYTVLFSATPAVHDYFHELRHGLMLIPCH